MKDNGAEVSFARRCFGSAEKCAVSPLLWLKHVLKHMYSGGVSPLLASMPSKSDGDGAFGCEVATLSNDSNATDRCDIPLTDAQHKSLIGVASRVLYTV